ncbi:MAG: hypothetical protein JST06_01500 [Bacteroidetes bacterium]|nr:hypothetical protein [Bacteroidota bacterium]MBS1630599.1 hypothetical protein [Bacteroidota bacterium]
MPIVIEELNVQVEVNSQSTEGNNQPNEKNTAGDERNPKAAMIKACVDEVMEVIKHQNER